MKSGGHPKRGHTVNPSPEVREKMARRASQTGTHRKPFAGSQRKNGQVGIPNGETP